MSRASVFSFVLLVLLLGSCRNFAPDSIPGFAAAPSLTSSSYPIRSTPGFTTMTPIMRPDNSATPAPVVIPTYQTVDSYINWLFSLGASPDCELPCWWGMVPGTTKIDDAREILSPFLLTRFPAFAGDPTGYIGYAADVSGEEIGGVSIGFWVRNGVVESIGVAPYISSDAPERSIANEIFYLDWTLDTYGVPSTVYVHLESEPPEQSSNWVYEILLVYEEHAAYLTYSGIYALPNSDEEFITACLGRDRFSSIGFSLFSDQVKLEDSPLIAAIGNFDIESRIRDGDLLEWEDATGKTLEEFTELFSANVGDICFQSPRSNWDH